MDTFSTYNNMDTDEPVTVKNRDDELYINWKLTKSRAPQEKIRLMYKQLRTRQATYFERASPDTPDEKLSPMIRILRNISRRNLWRNNMPRGKVVVNRSVRPTVASKWPSVHSSQAEDNADNVKIDENSDETVENKSKKPKKAASKNNASRSPRSSKRKTPSRKTKTSKVSESKKDNQTPDSE
ncbi:hypothetical protein LPJ73_002002 [Coemansia sp. RSA 2703]|nr:hypothetical protein LPJ73_002002 [Coemansia sp. RSA 2703]